MRAVAAAIVSTLAREVETAELRAATLLDLANSTYGPNAAVTDALHLAHEHLVNALLELRRAETNRRAAEERRRA